MGYLEFCSNCGNKNLFSFIDGHNRYHCIHCKTIHYENPKPTATLICPQREKILLVKRAKEPGKGLWGLPGGFIESKENPAQAGKRELKEETNLDGKFESLLGTCSHPNTMFGDILLIGLEMKINNWQNLRAGDDASDAKLFSLQKMPKLAFPCHTTILNFYKEKII